MFKSMFRKIEEKKAQASRASEVASRAHKDAKRKLKEELDRHHEDVMKLFDDVVPRHKASKEG